MLLVSFARFTQVGLSGNFSNLRRWGSLKIVWFGCGIHSSSCEFSALSICLVFELPGRCDVFDVNFSASDLRVVIQITCSFVKQFFVGSDLRVPISVHFSDSCRCGIFHCFWKVLLWLRPKGATPFVLHCIGSFFTSN